MHLPAGTPVLDLTVPIHARPALHDPYWLGRYDEIRADMYVQPLFGGVRCLHIGVDIGAPAGSEVFAPDRCTLVHQGYNPSPGDYGHVLVTRHEVGGREVFALWGHLSAASIGRHAEGHVFQPGAPLATLGAPHENGGWPPHLHLQLQWDRPATHDMPGVVRPDERDAALARHPDPAMLVGPFPAPPAS
jgi:hypothetical protein